MAGIEMPVMENQASYTNGGLSKLKSDMRLAVQTASQGQKAADYVLGKASSD